MDKTAKEQAEDRIRKLANEEAGKIVDAKQAAWDEQSKAADARIALLEAKIANDKVSLPGVNEVKEKFGFGRALYGMKTGDWGNVPFEHEVIFETAKEAGQDEVVDALKGATSRPKGSVKVMNSGLGSSGGFLIPEEFSNEIIELLVSSALVKDLGARFLDDLEGAAFKMARKTSASSTYMVGESGTPTASQIGVGQDSMTPKKMASLVKTTNRLEYLSNTSVERMIREDIAHEQALQIDRMCFRGTGTEFQPLGLTNIGGNLGSVVFGNGTDGAAMTIDKLLDFVAAVEQDLALKGKLGWVMNTRSIGGIRKFKDGVNQYYFIPNMAGPSPVNYFAGYPIRTTNIIPRTLTVGSTTTCTEAYFGNWAELIVALWRNMELRVLDQASDASGNNAALLDQLWFLAFTDFDCMFRHAESFCVGVDSTT